MLRVAGPIPRALRIAIVAALMAVLAATVAAQPSGLPGAIPDLPDVGKREGFVFTKSKEYPGTYEVYTDDGKMFHVSESFMKLTVRSPQLPSDKYLMVLENYPKMIESQYEIVMSKYYPDSAEETADFEDVTVGPNQGQTIHVSQDSEAGPYVRVRVEGANGEVKEFSASKSAVKDILNNPRLGVSQKIMALNKIPFTLPEEARDNFGELDRDKILELASDLPNVKRQEFVKMRKVFRETEKKREEGITSDPPDVSKIPTEAPIAVSDRGLPGPTTRGTPIIRITSRATPTPVITGAEEAAQTGGLSENFGLILVIVVVVIALALVGVRLFLYLRE